MKALQPEKSVCRCKAVTDSRIPIIWLMHWAVGKSAITEATGPPLLEINIREGFQSFQLSNDQQLNLVTLSNKRINGDHCPLNFWLYRMWHVKIVNENWEKGQKLSET